MFTSAFIVALFVVGLCVVLFSFFGFRRIHRFLKSLYQRFDNGQVEFRSLRGARAWIIVLAVFFGISALNGGMNAVSYLCDTASCIIAAILIPKVENV